MRSLSRPFVAALILSFCSFPSIAEETAPRLGFTLRVGLDPARLQPAEPGAVLTVRVIVPWAQVRTDAGNHDWDPVLERLRPLIDSGQRIHLALAGDNIANIDARARPTPEHPRSMEAWLDFVRSGVRALGPALDTLEIYVFPQDYEPNIYAFMFKQSALAAQAEAEAAGRTVRIALGALNGPAAAPFQRELLEYDVAPYVDVVPWYLSPEEPVAPAMKEMLEILLARPPAPELSILVHDGPGTTELETMIAALAAGAQTAIVDMRRADEQTVRWLLGSQALFDQGFAPAPLGVVRIEEPAGRATGRFLRGNDFTTLIGYAADSAEGQARLEVGDLVVRNGRSIDPVTGRELRTAARRLEGGDTKNALRAPLAPYPMWMLYQRGVATPGFELPPEELEVARERGLTAEEIIARYREVQRIQDDRLDRWTASGRIDFHFKLAQGGGSTVDVSIDSNYFWERGGKLEWEQTQYYINGNRIKWKNIPELPLIQPEKVVTLPLDLTLDKTYNYRLVGQSRVDGRPAYELDFTPTDANAGRSLYRGRVWIDRETFVRLRASVVQTNLDDQVLANEERDSFRPHVGPDGQTYWLLTAIEGQQVWSISGRNFVVRREVAFETFDINPPRETFEARRRTAYASNNQMLRDTDGGFRYLERKADGTRVEKEGVDTTQLAAAAGAFKDSSTDGVTPLAGIGFTSLDMRGSGVQLDALFAGAFGRLGLSKPRLWGTRLDAALDVNVLAILFKDELYVGGQLSPLDTVRDRGQNLSFRLGAPIGAFAKLTVIGDATWRDYAREEDSTAALQTFNANNGSQLFVRLPPDHLEAQVALQFEINRRGYNFTARASSASRSDWGEFGLVDGGTGTHFEFDGSGYAPASPPPVENSFRRWGVSASKEWVLPKFQKVRGAINWLDGDRLDRFSRYAFGLFGNDRLNGFAGSGVRFDRGTIARAGYTLNLFKVIRLDAALEAAWVENERTGDGTQRFGGLGISANFPLPWWKTIVNFNWGIALDSDIPNLEGEQEFLLLVFKLF